MADVLLEACNGVLVANATGNERIQVDAINKLLDAARSAATEIEALRKRCEAVEADAARYRWLIANQVEYRDGDDGLAWMTMQWNLGPASLAPGCIDSAISQAIAAAQEPSHG